MAVSAGSTEWTYAELDQGSNALAGQILECSDTNSEPVALLMHRGAPSISEGASRLRNMILGTFDDSLPS
jgi:hypothetical protein